MTQTLPKKYLDKNPATDSQPTSRESPLHWDLSFHNHELLKHLQCLNRSPYISSGVSSITSLNAFSFCFLSFLTHSQVGRRSSLLFCGSVKFRWVDGDGVRRRPVYYRSNPQCEQVNNFLTKICFKTNRVKILICQSYLFSILFVTFWEKQIHLGTVHTYGGFFLKTYY